MITDIIQGLNSDHKAQCSMVKVQWINSSMSMFKVQSSTLNVQREKMIRGIREIRSRCLNLLVLSYSKIVYKCL